MQIEGKSEINSVTLAAKDAMKIVEEDISIRAVEPSHLIVIEMQKETH